MISTYTRKQIKEELHWLAQYDQEALPRVLAAVRGGEINGVSYRYCVLGHAMHNDMEKAMLLADEMIEVLPDRCGLLEVENLILDVTPHTTPATSCELQTLEELLLEELGE